MTNPETDNGSAPKKNLEDFVSRDHLKIISGSSGGFYFRTDPTLPPESVGYTDTKTRVIYINPLHLESLPPVSVMGFLYHEVGHHSPYVVKFQDRVIESLGDEKTIPPSYKGDEETEKRFAVTVWQNLGNGLADIWLESYLSRRPYYPVRDSIKTLYTESHTWDQETFTMWPKPKQFIQSLLYLRYDPRQEAQRARQNFELDAQLKEELRQKVDPDVYEAIETVYKTGAVNAILERRSFENYFATETAHEQTVERKFQAYLQVFLPEYLKLVEAEIEQRKQQKSQEKSGQSQDSSAASDSSVPLTREEEREIAEQLLSELEGECASHQVGTLSDEEKQSLKDALDSINKQIESRVQGQEASKPQSAEEGDKDGLESLINRALQTLLEEQQKRQRGLSEAIGVRQESVKRWQEIKEEKRQEIESTAAALAEVFLDDRRKRIEYLMREGEVVPGLEAETITAILTGDLDPKTRMQEVRNPQFLETEVEFIVDRSGSMSGEPIEKSVEFLVMVTEAFKRVEEDLAGENLLAEGEHPLRVGVTSFSESPQRVTKLDEPITDEKEIKIVDEVAQIGGGTDESDAIQEVKNQLSLGAGNVLKIIVVLTDGYGNREAVEPIIRQIEEDDEIIFLAVGLGTSEEKNQGIVDTYIKPLGKPGEESNVFGIAAPSPNEAMPQIIDFLKREVGKRAVSR